jgi:hypothetical protein
VKRAYVDAALKLERESGRRQNNARIAAITGLTRSEVSQLSRQEEITGTKPPNRAQRVSIGWITDAEFCASPGSPKVLPFRGKRASFEKLVRNYSGDIPARAMLSEMVRQGMAREEVGNVRLLRTSSTIPRHALTTLRAISPWIRFLADNPNQSQELNANTVSVSLSFQSLPQMYSAIREIQERATAFVRSIDQLGAQSSGARPHKMHVSVGLAMRMPKARGASIEANSMTESAKK